MTPGSMSMTAPKLQKGEPSSLDTSHVNLKGSGLEGSGLEGGSERSAGASPKPAVEAAPATGLGAHVNACRPELVGPAERSLEHWLRRLVFRSAAFAPRLTHILGSARRR